MNPNMFKTLKRRKSLFLVFLIVILIAGCATNQSSIQHETRPVARLQREMDNLFESKDFSNAFWGVEIRSADDNQILYQHNAEKNLMPASNMKLYTSAAALYYLGTNSRYTTQVFGNAKITPDGVMDSDILIQGSGDPTISGRYTRGSITSQQILQNWVDNIKRLGIKTIQGNIVADNSVFDNINLVGSWPLGYTPSAFSAQIDGLSFNDNSFDLYYLPGENIGDTAKYWLGLPTNYLHIHSEVTTSAKGSRTNIDFNREWNTNDIYVSGQIPLGAETSREWGSVNKPALYIATLFYELLQKNGVQITGQPKLISEFTPEQKNEIYHKSSDIFMSYESAPLSTIIRIMNKYSQNFYAEQLLKTIGKQVKGEGSTRKGVQAVKEFLKEVGINTDQFEMVDGSGLSRSDMVQPHQTVELLRYMSKQKFGKAYFDSLPIGGVDGTISSRMKNPSIAGKVHAKTGFIGAVRCLSGYVTTADNETLVFSFMANNYIVPTRKAEEIQDKACELLANFSRKE